MKSENELVTIPGVCWRGWPIWATSTTSGWLLNSLAINCRAIRLNRAIPLHRLKLSQFPVAWTFTRASDTYLRANTSNRANPSGCRCVQSAPLLVSFSFLTWPCVERSIVQCRSTRDSTVNEIVYETSRVSFFLGFFSFLGGLDLVNRFLLRDDYVEW